MSWDERVVTRLRAIFRRVCLCQKPAEQDEGVMGDLEGGAPGRAPQYRLEATSKVQHKGMYAKFISCICGSQSAAGGVGIGINPNQSLAQYLHWMFRVNFVFLFAVMCMLFFVLVMIFAGFIISAGRLNPQCVRIGGAPFNSATSDFADAFALSWTTFSTVGYGSTYPALGHENNDRTNCLFITVVCSLESFLGVLYSGFCGAILFGKVLRIQSHAQVIFSDPIVIRYGSGVQRAGIVADSSDEDDGDVGVQKIPCPVLEFRVVNRLFNEVGGEIMDATLNVVANVDANDADPSIRETLDSERQQHVRSRQNSVQSSTADSTSDTYSDPGRISASGSDIGPTSFFSKNRFLDTFGSILQSKRDHHAVDEDPSARLVNKRIFSKMMLEAGEHPFFKRVWLAHHVLDETSPILKPRVRRQIRRNRGFWPERLNNYKDVRDSLQFNQILVSLNGVSNVSASDVYAQKIYDFVDINVGYQFVNILYRDTDGTLKVDTDLINDVREQNGGGGEPLILGE